MRAAPTLTVIGSYPVNIQNQCLMQTYFDTLTQPSWQTYIANAVNEMVDAGIHLISDGQTRDPFVTIFARGLKGCRIRDRPEVIDRITYTHPITCDDLRYVRTIIPKETQLLGLIVGPHTFSETVSDLYYNDKEKLAFDAAEALAKEAKAIAPYVDIISIDEPYFSTSFPPYAKDLIERVVSKIDIPLRLHVCGDVSKITSELLDMPVDILSHEFKATPRLFDCFKEYPEPNKKFCIGCIRSDTDTIETTEDIIMHIEKAYDVFGDSIVQLSPDCGLRLVPKNIAKEKLKQLRYAWEQLFI
ncbi:MAG: hypothetical protein QCH96_04220 [Candidatus Thermoplasmatota archaeon]|nr:hypothetical protein [Candidatus Thermoplasmatota archaeon]